nr:zinc finger, CCHC-type [Tanacetum cinerariifolium]
KEQKGFFLFGLPGYRQQRVCCSVFLRQGAAGYRQVKVFEFFDCPGLRQGVEDLRELLHKDKQPEEDTNTDCLVKELEKEYQTRWKIKTGNVLDSCNQRSTQCMKSGVAKHLGIAGIKQQNRYGSVHVLQGVEFEVEPQEDHTFEVEPHGNVDRWQLFSYREDSNEATFAVAAVEKIYAHESLTFNDTVACEVISKWNAGLKEDMDVRSDVWYGFFYECKAEIWVTKCLLDIAKGNILGMKIVKDQSGNTLSVSQSKFYNEKLVQTMYVGRTPHTVFGG